MAKTEESIREVFEVHLPYEIDRLIEQYKLALDLKRYVTTDAGGYPSKLAPEISDALDDALIVGFCTHARNLVEFFCRKKSQYYATALDYATKSTTRSYERLDRERDDVNRLYTQLCAQINHLTYERTDKASEQIDVKERKELIDLIYNEARRLSESLMPEYEAKYLRVDELAKAAVMQVPVLGGAVGPSSYSFALSSQPVRTTATIHGVISVKYNTT